MQPASETKHIQQLAYEFGRQTFLLNQRDQHGLTNGTTLWLGGQVLSYYLKSILEDEGGGAPSGGIPARRKAAIELGSGIGLAALVLHSLGWNVCATDVEPVLSSVLKPNIINNHASSMRDATRTHLLECKELDWTVPVPSWRWDQPHAIARHAQASLAGVDETMEPNINLPTGEGLAPPYDLIITADTLYTPGLITPLLRTLYHLSHLSLSPNAKYSCPVYIAVERRDPQLMDRAFAECSGVWGFKIERIRAAKIKRALEKAGVGWVNERSLWEGVEIWKMRLPAGAGPSILNNEDEA